VSNTGGIRPRGDKLLPAVGRARCADASVGRRRAGLPSWAKSGMAARFENKTPFLFLFQKNSSKFSFLSNQKLFLGFGVKIKVAQNFMIFNFAKRSKVKIQIDFELQV
jgi:hypothetical protein